MSNVDSFLDGMSTSQRLGFGAGVLGIIASAVALWVWSSQVSYGVLYGDLSQAHASAITRQLNDLKVPYKISTAGDAVLVDQKNLHETRLRLADSGVRIDGQVGFELFDKVEYGMSEFSQKIILQRALQGEIARTITALVEVRSARVHLVMPESGLFKKNHREPKASVHLVTQNGAVLNREQVNGIQVLVSSSVRGLEPGRVLIIGEDGTPLSRQSDNGALSNRLEQKREVELYLAAKAREVLDQIYGVQVGLVEVDVALNFESIERKTETMLPGGSNGTGLIVEQKKTSKRNASGGSGDTNKSNEVLTDTSEVKYAIGRSVEQFVQRAGSVKRVTVSVVVPKSENPAQTENIRNLISMAVGIDSMRGDKVEVVAMGLVDSMILIPGGVSGESSHGAALSADAKQADIQSQPGEKIRSRSDSAFPAVVPVTVLIAVCVFALLLIAVVWNGGRRKQEPDLTSVERQQLLGQIQGWMNDDLTQKEVVE